MSMTHDVDITCFRSMSLSELQQEHAELLEFNDDLDRRCKSHKAQADKYKFKLDSIAHLFVVPNDDHEMTIRAIKTILTRVGEA